MSEKKLRITAETDWMNGRLVFDRPESPASVVAERRIITTSDQREALTESLVASLVVRRAMTEADIVAEIAELNAFEATEQ